MPEPRALNPVPLHRFPAPVRCLLALCALLAALASPAAALDQLAAELDREARRSARSLSNLAVHVVDLGADELDYAYRADARMVPASNQKLLTTAAALSLLGPGYTFETQLGMRGSLGEDGVLAGDLAVRGAGDPTISGRFEGGDSYAIFRRWAAALAARGVRTVTGDLYLEHGLFEGSTVHPDWPPEQQMWWYEAPVAALSFSDNAQLLRGWGARRAGQPAVLELQPSGLGVLELRNRTRTVTGGKIGWAVDRKPGSRVVDVTGQLQTGSAPVEVWVTVTDPVEYFGAALREALAQEGIAVHGALRPVERLPGPWWERVDSYRSVLLTSLDVANKRSQNFYAESLFKLLGARLCEDGSWQGGARAVSEFLTRDVGLPGDSFRVVDGSGMSRNNSLTARSLTRLLEHMFAHRWGLEFVTSLPFTGEPEGTLHKRLVNPPYRGNVFAKTGTLGGVATLSGYAKGGSGRLYAFSILANGGSAWEGRLAHDRLLQVLIDHG